MVHWWVQTVCHYVWTVSMMLLKLSNWHFFFKIFPAACNNICPRGVCQHEKLKLKENVNRFGCVQNVARIRWHMWKFLFYCMLSLTNVQKTQAQPFGVLVVLSVTQDFVQILILLIFMSSQITIYNGALLPSILMVIIIFLLKTSRCLYGQPVQFWHLLPHIHVFVVLSETCLLPGHSIS